MATPPFIIDDYARLWEHVERLPWCALFTTGRTGTDFFQSLLDSHPEIFVFNGKLFFHDFWSGAVTVNSGSSLVATDIVDEFVGTNILSLKSRYDTFERKHELGETRDQSLDIDLSLFRQETLNLLALRPVTSRNLLTAIYVAYAICRGEDVFRKKLFFHHLHRIGRAQPFIDDFPGSKIICMIRDPRANYVSGVEHWRQYDPIADNPSYPLYVLRRAIDEANDLWRYPVDDVRILRLEDLGNAETLKAITAWLGVAHDACLGFSSWGGLRWWGDRLSMNRIPANEKGYSPTIVSNRWQDKLSTTDQFLLNYLLGDMLRAYGYVYTPNHGRLAALLVPFLILLPTTYERRYLTPAYLWKLLRQRRIRAIVASIYHPLRRIAYFYQLLGRTLTKQWRFLPRLAKAVSSG